MSKKIRKNTPVPVNQYTTLSQGLLAAVCILIFYPPFLRGLYFDLEIAVSFVLTALLVLGSIVLKIKKRDNNYLSTPLDGAILLYAVAYLLAIINAVHVGEAVWGFLKALNYFLIYMLVAQVVPDLKAARTIIKTLLAAAVGVAVIGLMAANGYSDYPGAFVNNHIMSTLQYHNTTAAYLGAMCFAGFALLLTTVQMSRKLIYSSAIYLLALVTVTAISKGALLIVMAAAFLFFVGAPRRYRLVYLYNLIYLFAVAFLTSSMLMPQITGAEPARGVIVILAGLCLALIGQPLAKSLVFISKAKYFKRAAIAILITVIVSTGLFIATPAGQQLVPRDLTEEIAEIADFSDASYLYRADFIRWGIDIAGDYPLFGSGAGGWKALLPQYQDYKYFAADAHNHMIQVLVETGVFGLLVYIAIWVAGIMAVIKFSRRTKQADQKTEESILILWGAFSAAAAIGLHALIDFDLSIPAVFIIMITLLALINQIAGFNGKPWRQQKSRWQFILPALLAFLLLLVGGSLAVGQAYNNQGTKQLQAIDISGNTYAQDREAAIVSLEKSVIFAPLNADARVKLSKCYASLYLDLARQGNPGAAEAYQNTLDAIMSAEKIMPNDAEIISGALTSAVTIGNLDASLRLARQSVEIGPNNSSNYQALGEVLYAAARYYLESGDTAAAQKLIDELAELPAVIAEQQSRSNQERLSARMGRQVRVTEELAEIIENTDELQFMHDMSSSGKGDN